MSIFDRIKREIRSPMVMYTPSKKARFTVHPVENEVVPFTVGSGVRIKVPKTCWDEMPNYLRGKGWVEIGQRHGIAPKGSFEEHLDGYLPSHPSWASYVVPVLDHLKIVEVDHGKLGRNGRPAKVKLI